MKTKTKLSNTEIRFNRKAEDLRKDYPDSFERKEQEADDCFGSRTTISVFNKSSYASWTLWRNEGKHCDKRTHCSSFGMMKGKRVSARDAMMRIRNNY